MKTWVVGIDEVGRGPLAGPVVVCGVAIPEEDYERVIWKGLTDSKKMSSKHREKWYVTAQELQLKHRIKIHIASREAKDVDGKGIQVCIRECISEILEKMALAPHVCRILLDGGLRAPEIYINQKTIIKGDEKEKIISLASVIAKVFRDHHMEDLHKENPGYEWYANKGYGTAKHRKAIQNKGISEEHRKTYLTKILDKI